MSAPSSPYAGIEHIVVLMLENRSFDNMLGATIEPGATRSNQYYPLGTKLPAVTVPAFTLPGRNELVASIPTPDPGEWWQYMNQQIFGLLAPPPVNATSPTAAGPLGPMGGFLQNYWQTLSTFGYPTLLAPTIMHQYTADQLPVTSALAKAFAVSDQTFASAPCQTMPNRCFAQLGSALGYVNNNSYLTGDYNVGTDNAPYFATSIFGQINATPGLDWKVYFNDFPLTALMMDTWVDITTKFHFFDQFASDVAAGTLPQYSWIEPAYQIFASDNHPPHDVNIGEYLLAEVYNTLRANPAVWANTLLIVTYDEHGGCYDHVAPPAAMPDAGWTTRVPYFNFNRYGVRVPTLLISPRIAPGVGTPGTTPGNGPNYDHTSILATVRNCFNVGGGPLSNREQNASDYSAFLTLGSNNPNNGPASVAVGLSKAELAAQAVVNTFSSLAQLWYENHRKIPANPALAKLALAARAAGDLSQPMALKGLTDQEKLADIHDGLIRLFGRRPTGLMQWQ